jgi:hypothetical protein
MANSENTYGHAREKLYQAVNSLATGTGTIQDRPESATMVLNPLQSPQNGFRWNCAISWKVIQELTRTPAQGTEGRFKATLRIMSDEEGAKIAQRILSLYIELRGGI